MYCHIPWNSVHTANAPPRNRHAGKYSAGGLLQDAWAHNVAHYLHKASALLEDMSSTERGVMSWHVASSWAWNAASSSVEHS